MTTNGNTAEAIRATLISPNEMDSNFESANVVDGLFAIARALHAVAKAIEKAGIGESARGDREVWHAIDRGEG